MHTRPYFLSLPSPCTFPICKFVCMPIFVEAMWPHLRLRWLSGNAKDGAGYLVSCILSQVLKCPSASGNSVPYSENSTEFGLPDTRCPSEPWAPLGMAPNKQLFLFVTTPITHPNLHTGESPCRFFLFPFFPYVLLWFGSMAKILDGRRIVGRFSLILEFLVARPLTGITNSASADLILDLDHEMQRESGYPLMWVRSLVRMNECDLWFSLESARVRMQSFLSAPFFFFHSSFRERLW